MILYLSAIEHNAGIDSISILIIILIFFLFVLIGGFNRISILRIRRKSEQAKDLSVIMKHTLNMSNNCVLRLSIQDQYAMNMHGNFLPETGLGYKESLNYIHPDDRHFYIDFCKKLVSGENASQCLFRWDVNRGKGQKNWHYYRDLGVAEYANPKLKTPTNIFCVLTDMTEQIKQDQRNTELTEATLSSDLVYKGSVIDLTVDKVSLPDGGTTEREVVHHRGAVAIVPVTDAGEIVLEEQYRYAAGKILTEIPAGKLEPEEAWDNDTPDSRLAAAHRDGIGSCS